MPLQTANIIGSGPNGLAAAITLAQRGVAVTVYERNATLGGACSTAEVTLPGFHHDLGSSCYPLGIASPFFRSLPLAAHGLRWIEPPAPARAPTGRRHRRHPRARSRSHSRPTHAARCPRLALAPRLDRTQLAPTHRRLHPASPALPQPPYRHGHLRPRRPHARAAARLHTLSGRARPRPVRRHRRPFRAPPHPHRQLRRGPCPRGRRPHHRLANRCRRRTIHHQRPRQLPPIPRRPHRPQRRHPKPRRPPTRRRDTLRHQRPAARSASPTPPSPRFRTTAPQIPPRPRHLQTRLRALSQPIPWRSPECLRAATIHLGGSLAEIPQSEHDAFYGRHSTTPLRPRSSSPASSTPPARPQASTPPGPTATSPTAPPSTCTAIIETQIERFAPGFRDSILARRASNAAALAELEPQPHRRRHLRRRHDALANFSSDPPPTAIAPATPASTSAAPPRPPAAESTACAAISPRSPPIATSGRALSR